MCSSCIYINGMPSLSHTVRLGVVYELAYEAPQEAHDGWLLTLIQISTLFKFRVFVQHMRQAPE